MHGSFCVDCSSNTFLINDLTDGLGIKMILASNILRDMLCYNWQFLNGKTKFS